jgi:hypothetical protein
VRSLINDSNGTIPRNCVASCNIRLTFRTFLTPAASRCNARTSGPAIAAGQRFGYESGVVALRAGAAREHFGKAALGEAAAALEPSPGAAGRERHFSDCAPLR